MLTWFSLFVQLCLGVCHFSILNCNMTVLYLMRAQDPFEILHKMTAQSPNMLYTINLMLGEWYHVSFDSTSYEVEVFVSTWIVEVKPIGRGGGHMSICILWWTEEESKLWQRIAG